MRWAWPTSPTAGPTPISSCTSTPGTASPGILLVEEAGGRVNDFLAGDGLRRGNPILAAAPGVADAIAALAGVPLLG